MLSRMGGWSGLRSARPAQRCHRTVLVQVQCCLVIPVGIGRCARCGGKAASLQLKRGRRVQAAKRSFLQFEEARAIVREVGLERKEQWWEWSRDCRPADIPSQPHVKYKDKGWVSWRDWLGYGEGEPPRDEFLPFEEAREMVRELGLGGQKQWKEWSRDCRPADIPSHPDVTYADEGWVSMADWLGYGKTRHARHV